MGALDMKVIYFAQAQPSGLVKVGITGQIEKRLKTLSHQRGEPLTLIGVFVGNLTIEQHAHETLQAHRSHGEWYFPTEAVLRLAGCSDSVAFMSAVGLHERFYYEREETPLCTSVREAMATIALPPVTRAPATPGERYWGEWLDLLGGAA